jgi:hypothetical protein
MTGDAGGESRWLYRSRRTIWQSADGSKDGALRVEVVAPKALPGWPIPEIAYEEMGSELLPLGRCAVPANERTDYASLRKLPADPDGMRTHLYDRAALPGGTATPDDLAWERARTLMLETYLPPAQRAALFRAIATIDGVSVVDSVEDAAGRTGIGVGRVGYDARTDLILDRDTYEFLGEREVVVDPERAGAPVGSLVASTAQLDVSVSDVAPEIESRDVTIEC